MPTIVRIDDIVITIGEKLPNGEYQAWAGDLDIGTTFGYGRTRVAAASDLLDQLETYDRQLDALRVALVEASGSIPL